MPTSKQLKKKKALIKKLSVVAVVAFVVITSIVYYLIKQRTERPVTYKVPAIVRGEYAPEGEHPFVVRLSNGPLGQGHIGYCGGSLLNSEWIITAAHCILDYPSDTSQTRYGVEELQQKPDITIYVGIYNVRNLSENKYPYHVSPIEVAVPNPNFAYVRPTESTGFGMNDYDIGLIKLQEPVDVDGRFKPVVLNTNTAIDNELEFTIAGWGNTALIGQDYVPSDRLKMTTLQQPRNVLDTIMISFGSSDSGTGAGDSGSPVFYQENGQYILAGVHYGSNYDYDNQKYISLDVRVSKFADWIQQTIDGDTGADNLCISGNDSNFAINCIDECGEGNAGTCEGGSKSRNRFGSACICSDGTRIATQRAGEIWDGNPVSTGERQQNPSGDNPTQTSSFQCPADKTHFRGCYNGEGQTYAVCGTRPNEEGCRTGTVDECGADYAEEAIPVAICPDGSSQGGGGRGQEPQQQPEEQPQSDGGGGGSCPDGTQAKADGKECANPATTCDEGPTDSDCPSGYQWCYGGQCIKE